MADSGGILDTAVNKKGICCLNFRRGLVERGKYFLKNLSQVKWWLRGI